MLNRLQTRLALPILAVVATATAVSAGSWVHSYRQGLDLAEARQWHEALGSFRAAAAEKPYPQVLAASPDGAISEYDPYFHIARCLVEMDRPRDAGIALALSARAGVTPRDRIENLRSRIRESGVRRLGQQRGGFSPPRDGVSSHGRLSVNSDPPGAVVIVDGRNLGVTPFGPKPLPPGQYQVRIELAGYEPIEVDAVIVAGQPEELTVQLLPFPPPTSVPTGTPIPPLVTWTAAEPAPLTPPREGPEAAATPAETPAEVNQDRPEPATPAPQGVAGKLAARGRSLVPLLPAVAVLGLILIAVIALVLARRKPAAAPTPVLTTSTPVPPGAEAAAAAAPGSPAAGAQPPAVPPPPPLDLPVAPSVASQVGPPTAPTRVIEGAATELGAPTPTAFGKFAIVGTLGRGGMGTTFRANRLRDGAPIALKIPHDSCLAEQSFVARFVREGKLGEQLHHPNIVRIFEAGEVAGRPFLAMELLSGRTLKSLLRESGRLPLRRAIEIARDIAEALDYAHLKGVVHRDLKPENVMILPDGAVKVMDFGIARVADQPGLTTSNLFLGTPLYAAPEMVDPKTIDHRADLYSLGIILFEMLEGTVPFIADSPFRVLEMHLREPLPSPESLARPLPPEIWSVVTRLCEKNPAQRYPGAETLLIELQGLLQHLPADAEGA